MKRLLLGAALASGLVTFGIQGFSQERDEGYWRGRLFDRVREDIDQVQARTPVFSSDEFRLGRAKEQLTQLQKDAATGKFVDRDLDEVIGTLQRVVSDNRMPERDRAMLTDDLNRLRDFKEHHERYYPR
ncbi:MAG TPA: hypothetical protein VIY49_24175 [Bryobacteraceae bacterium]